MLFNSPNIELIRQKIKEGKKKGCLCGLNYASLNYQQDKKKGTEQSVPFSFWQGQKLRGNVFRAEKESKMSFG
ncbi:MAG: hypothetical protein IPN99_09785 [Bacteroidetes bacterium]|nr:hypothetical protein [Bacteroidota bacterium]